jgi:hypothetical protein
LGPHQRCDELCPVCSEDRGCFESICLPQDPLYRPDGCAISLRGEDAFSGNRCFDSRSCLQRRDDPDFDTQVYGVCVDDEVCDQLVNIEAPETYACRYFDGSEYEDGPSYPTECPEIAPGVGDLGSFCGGACGECQPVSVFGAANGDWVSCVGINEERGYGVCALTGDSAPLRCRPAPGVNEVSYWRGADGWGGNDADGEYRRAHCMRLRQEDGTPHVSGWVVMGDTCAAYVRNFPGSFECSRMPQ